MAQQTGGGSVQACAMRIAKLELDGVPLPGAGNLYVTDTFGKLDATPVVTKGIDIEVMNACGGLPVTYKDRDRLKRYDLVLELEWLDPELEFLLIGGELFTASAFSVGGAVPAVGVVDNIGGVSMELWSKHIVNGDIDVIWPYIQWIFPRTYWAPDKMSWSNGHSTRNFTGYCAQNPNYFNGPTNDWTFASDRLLAWRFTKTIPTPQLGSQTEVAS